MLKTKWPIVTACGFASAVMIFGCRIYNSSASIPQNMAIMELGAYDPAHPFDDLPAAADSGKKVTVDGLFFPVIDSAINIRATLD